MKTIKSLCGMLAILALSACSNNNDDALGSDNHIWHVTLTASMGDATNRALSAEGDNISASFAENDQVVVVDADGSTIVGTLKAKTAGASTTLTGTINASTLTVDEVVKLRYLSATPNYDGQVGTLAGISSYSEGTLKVKTTSPLTFTPNSVSFSPMQSITKFSFTDGTNPVNVKTFGIAATGLVQSIAKSGTETVGAVTGTLATASSDVYVALRNKELVSQAYSFYIQDESHNWYTSTRNATLVNGKNYRATVALTKLSTSLTSSSADGTIGVIDGLPAIVVTIGGSKKAIALMNAGALCPEHYGEYYTYTEQSSAVSSSWYVPTQDDFEKLAGKPGTWGAKNGVNGLTFTIEGENLFFPAAGYYDNDPTPLWLSPTWGYYCSKTLSTDRVVSFQFNNSTPSINSSDKTDGLTVRPFHDL